MPTFDLSISLTGLFSFFLLILLVGYIFVEILFGEKYFLNKSITKNNNHLFDRTLHYIGWGIILNLGNFYLMYFAQNFDNLANIFNTSGELAQVFGFLGDTISIQLTIFSIIYFTLLIIIILVFYFCLNIIIKLIGYIESEFSLKNEVKEPNNNIFTKFVSLKKIKNPFKKQQNIEEEKPITFQEIGNLFFETLLSITPAGIAIIGGLILGAGIFLQYSIISQFLGTNIQGLYLVNIETSILYTFSVIIYFLVSLIFPFVLIISLILTILFFSFTQDLISYIFTGFFIIGILLLKFQWYKKFLLRILKKFGKLYFIIIFISLIVINHFSQKEYTNIEVTTPTETFTGKLFFSNGENYFIETGSGKIILPKSEVNKILLLKKD